MFLDTGEIYLNGFLFRQSFPILSHPPELYCLVVEEFPKKRQFKFDVKDRLKLEDEPEI